MSQPNYKNPFDPECVSDAKWQEYVRRYLAERGNEPDTKDSDSQEET